MRAMLSQQEIDRIRPAMRSLRLVIGAMFLGTTTFGIVTAFQRGPTAFAPQLNLAPLPLIALVLTASAAAMSFVIPKIILGQKSEPTNSDADDSGLGKQDFVSQAASRINNTSIVAVALLEAPAFLNLFVVISGQGGLVHLLLAGALALCMFVYFPFTEGTFVDRVERLISSNDQL